MKQYDHQWHTNSNRGTSFPMKARGQVNSTEENDQGFSSTPIIQFKSDDESMQESQLFRGEVMEIGTWGTIPGKLHPIMIITLPNKKQSRVAAKALLNQCCIDKGLTLWHLVHALGHPTSTGEARIFTTTAGLRVLYTIFDALLIISVLFTTVKKCIWCTAPCSSLPFFQSFKDA